MFTWIAAKHSSNTNIDRTDAPQCWDHEGGEDENMYRGARIALSLLFRVISWSIVLHRDMDVMPY